MSVSDPCVKMVQVLYDDAAVCGDYVARDRALKTSADKILTNMAVGPERTRGSSRQTITQALGVSVEGAERPSGAAVEGCGTAGLRSTNRCQQQVLMPPTPLTPPHTPTERARRPAGTVTLPAQAPGACAKREAPDPGSEAELSKSAPEPPSCHCLCAATGAPPAPCCATRPRTRRAPLTKPCCG